MKKAIVNVKASLILDLHFTALGFLAISATAEHRVYSFLTHLLSYSISYLF